MAFTLEEIPAGVPYYDLSTGTVKQLADRWMVPDSVTGKVFAIEPTTLSKAWMASTAIRPATPSSTYVRVGSPYRLAALIAYILNNPLP